MTYSDHNVAYGRMMRQREDAAIQEEVARRDAPSVHLNGTSGESLLQGYIAAAEALRAAHKALCECAPHPRDYYVKADRESFAKAEIAHAMRLAKIDAMLKEIEVLGEAVVDQVNERAKR